MTRVRLDIPIAPEHLSYEIEQTGHHIAILLARHISQPPGYCAPFIMWDLVTQERIAVGSLQTVHSHPLISCMRFQNLFSWEYLSCLVLFGAIRDNPSQSADDRHQPDLEIIDPAMLASVTTLELNKNKRR